MKDDKMNPDEFVERIQAKAIEYQIPTEREIMNYIGRTVLIDGKKVKIETICGNKITPTFFEINGQHLIGMLRFYCQMEGDHSFSEQEYRDFEESVCWAEQKKSAIEVPHVVH